MQASPLSHVEVKRTAHFMYDFALNGGAVGDIVLANDVLPDDALIVSGMIHVKTLLVGATATIALKAAGAEDVLAATAVATFAAGAIIDVVPDGTATNAIKLAAKANLTVTIATAALTAGAFEVYLDFYMGA